MATPPKPGARNDLNALRDARRFNRDAHSNAERAIDELVRMREQIGRPDYSRMNTLLGQLALDVSKASRCLDEMWTLRAMAGQVVDEDLAQRLTALEAQLEGLREVLGVIPK